ncbi:Dipeptidyl aminopeptidase/acylaminoacyl peptidase [Alkalibacterium putridalgicola]|uniref:Dipeptidyl aminopeptidase/acylaminoacyl peptidase n=1 Tax=Alkalibacterium putridalgicola TaxID=426703 RepID=A0A1H7W3Z9_9LACT|nr:S9 family peptidase [Alkalibacterium putridalgicola]GEK90011.1 peptidase S9 [Alkalibacterium putridalgicola]SEM15819.1 Dipeptidyl aminopeptidase/acylaminoacyl peptidase [Alkalibacterium putridalgicola]
MKPITSESLFDLKNVSQPLVHGDRLFYLETRTDKEKNSYLTSAWSLQQKTRERVQWVSEELNPSQLEISPNEKWLSFLSAGEGKKPQVFIMPLEGGGATPITDEKEGVSTYEWTSNGASVYYQTSFKEEEEEDKTDEAESKKFKPKPITKLQYKMDGQGITDIEKTYQVKKLDVASKKDSVILEKDRPFRLQYVSKDESFLLFVDKLDPDNEWVYGASVYEYDIAKEESQLITKDIPKGSFSFEAVNETENVFLFTGNDFSHAFVTLNKVFGWNRKERTFKELSAEDKYVGDVVIGDFQQKTNGFPLVWLTDDTFVYPVTEEGKLQLYKGDTEGNNERVFGKKIHLTDGALIENNKFVVTYSDLNTPSVLAVLDINSGRLEIVYDPNKTFSQEHAYAEIEEFWYKGADDWDIQGWYVSPTDNKKDHPAILYIHGGPQVCYGETFFHEMQQLASEGYGVIMLNPRGGNGYGQEFVASILGDYGNKDYEDLMLGTDHILNDHPEIDQERVFVAGGSYGGFMTNWIVGHTDRFKAGVTQRCISNWLSFYGTSDVGAFFVEFQLKKEVKQAQDLWKMSPLAYATNIKTPLLVIHGEEDLRCPQEQGEQMYTAMKKQGVDTKMVLYPKSSHGLSRAGLPHLRLDRMEEIKSWFKKYN